MAELNGYRCPNCNAMIPIPKHGNIYKCECCGSEFEKEQDYLKPLKVEVCNAKLVTLGYKTAIQDEYLKDETIKEKVIEHSLNNIAHELAKKIVPYMEIEIYKDPCKMLTIINGRVRIAERQDY